jgi:hypothetical protein
MRAGAHINSSGLASLVTRGRVIHINGGGCIGKPVGVNDPVGTGCPVVWIIDAGRGCQRAWRASLSNIGCWTPRAVPPAARADVEGGAQAQGSRERATQKRLSLTGP